MSVVQRQILNIWSKRFEISLLDDFVERRFQLSIVVKLSGVVYNVRIRMRVRVYNGTRKVYGGVVHMS